MRLINLTAMPVALCDRGGRVRWYEPSGIVPHVVARESVPLVPEGAHEIQVLNRVEVAGLPAPCPDGFSPPILYIVDPLIAHLCAADRWDLCSVDPTSTIGPGGLTGLIYYRRLICWDLTQRVGLPAHEEGW